MEARALLRTHERTTGDGITIGKDDTPLLDLRWIPGGWWRLVTGLHTRQDIPRRVNRRHVEACLGGQILMALTNGDRSIDGGNRVGNPVPRVCAWSSSHARSAEYGTLLGCSVDPDTLVTALQTWVPELATKPDQAVPANDHVTRVAGRPVIHRPQRAQDPPGLADLKRPLAGRRRPRRILAAVADPRHWLKWTAPVGPRSGCERTRADSRAR